MRLTAWLTAALAAAELQGAAAQDARGWVTSAVHYAQIRPLVADTVPQERTVERAPGVFEFEGERVQCILEIGCVRWIAAPVESAALATHDLALTGWGFGVQGLSATVGARVRTRLGGALVWPRSDDAFDLTTGYVQLDRGTVRARVGRQESLSGLGAAAYDGADVLVALGRGVRAQAYGGRSLARGLREPRAAALRGLQDFLPERGAYLLGAAVSYLAGDATSAELRYQRELWSDRRGLIAERAALDARSTRFAPVTIGAALDYDFGVGQVGKAQLQLRLPVAAAERSAGAVELTARRYLPFFELHTIWGFFSPVAYHELEVRGSWANASLGAWAAGAYRAYRDAGAPAFLEAPASTGWRASGGGRWSPGPAWSANVQGVAEVIPGGLLTSTDVAVTASLGARVALTATGSAFQQIEEFRIGDGRVLGAALAVDAALTRRLRAEAGGGAYRHRDATKRDAFDWSQLRAWSSLRMEVGGDPGRAGAR